MNDQQETDNSSICYDKLEIGKLYKIKNRGGCVSTILYLGKCESSDEWVSFLKSLGMPSSRSENARASYEASKENIFKYLIEGRIFYDFCTNYAFEEL